MTGIAMQAGDYSAVKKQWKQVQHMSGNKKENQTGCPFSRA